KRFLPNSALATIPFHSHPSTNVNIPKSHEFHALPSKHDQILQVEIAKKPDTPPLTRWLSGLNNRDLPKQLRIKPASQRFHGIGHPIAWQHAFQGDRNEMLVLYALQLRQRG